MAKPRPAIAKRDVVKVDVFARTPRQRVAEALRSRFALRVHTSILLAWTFSAGLLTTKAMFAVGVQSMFTRYTVAILVAYAAFLLGVRIWMAYVGAGSTERGTGNARHARNARSANNSSIDVPDVFPSGSGSGGGGSLPVFGGHGGASGGGGASASFDGGGSAAPPANLLSMEGVGLSAPLDAGGAGDAAGGDGGSVVGDLTGKVGDVVGDIGSGDDGCLIAFAIMIVVGLAALAIGGAVFVISAGPEVLIDAAFNAMLAGGLIKAGKRVSDPDWMGSVIKATWIPLVVVLAMAWLFAAAAAALTPQAHTFGEVMRIVWPRLLQAI